LNVALPFLVLGILISVFIHTPFLILFD